MTVPKPVKTKKARDFHRGLLFSNLSELISHQSQVKVFSLFQF